MYRSGSLKDFVTWQATGMLRSSVSNSSQFIERFITLDQKGMIWKDEVYNALSVADIKGAKDAGMPTIYTPVGSTIEPCEYADTTIDDLFELAAFIENAY